MLKFIEVYFQKVNKNMKLKHIYQYLLHNFLFIFLSLIFLLLKAILLLVIISVGMKMPKLTRKFSAVDADVSLP